MNPFEFAALSLSMFTPYQGKVKSWSIRANIASVLSLILTTDFSFIPEPSDYPGAVGFLFNRPVYLIDDETPVNIQLIAHMPGSLVTLDDRNKISEFWSN